MFKQKYLKSLKINQIGSKASVELNGKVLKTSLLQPMIMPVGHAHLMLAEWEIASSCRPIVILFFTLDFNYSKRNPVRALKSRNAKVQGFFIKVL